MDEQMAGDAHVSIKGASQIHEEQLELLAYWRTLIKHKFTIVGLALALAVLAGVVAYMITPSYKATATLKLEDNNAKVLSIEQVYASMSQGSEQLQTQAAIIASRTVADLVVQRLHLDSDPAFAVGAHASLRDRIMRMLGATKPLSADARKQDLENQLLSRLSVAPVRMSNLITVTFEASDPQKAAAVANAFASLYIENDMDAKFRMTQQANVWLNDHLVGLKSKLEASEQRLQDYRDREHIIDIKGQALSGSGNQLEGLVTNLVTARMRRAEAQSAYEQIKNAQAAGQSLASLPMVMKDPVVNQMQQVVAEKERKVSELGQVYGPKNIKMIQAQAELQQAKDSLNQQVAVVVGSVQHQYQETRANENALAGAVAEVQGSIRNANKKQFELGDLERDVQTNQQLYDLFVQRYKETSASSDLTKPVAQLIDPAVVPTVPVSPKKTQIVLGALLVGLILGVVVAFLVERLDTTVRTTEEVGLRLGQPILTTLPLLKNREDTGKRYLEDPRSQFAEAIRTARTGVLLSAIDVPNKVLVVTSSLPGEGKTTFASNLALAHAQTKRVLLIDADMRRPRLAKALGLDTALTGLSELASGEAELADCLVDIENSTLQVITAGAVPPNPLELLLSQRFKDLLTQLSQQFDLVIIDSPPVHLVSDAVILATMATGVIFVMKANSTPYQVARRCLRALVNARATLFGVVLNQLDFRKAETYYGDYHAYAAYGKEGTGYYSKEAA